MCVCGEGTGVGIPWPCRCVAGKASRVSSFTVPLSFCAICRGFFFYEERRWEKFFFRRRRKSREMRASSSIHLQLMVITRQSDRVGVISTRATQPQPKKSFFSFFFFFFSFLCGATIKRPPDLKEKKGIQIIFRLIETWFEKILPLFKKIKIK